MAYRKQQTNPYLEQKRLESRMTLGDEIKHWEDYANCLTEQPDTFFPTDGVGVEIAKRICQNCVVKEECLEFALSTRQDHGVWGGMSERGRRLIIKQQKQNT